MIINSSRLISDQPGHFIPSWVKVSNGPVSPEAFNETLFNGGKMRERGSR
jgi:hypothetical protein